MGNYTLHAVARPVWRNAPATPAVPVSSKAA
jgi:hypothetical protein